MTKNSGRSLLLAVVLSCLALWGAFGPSIQAQDSPATAPSTQARQDPALAGLQHALAGQFNTGLAELAKAAKVRPQDIDLQGAVKVLDSYVAAMAKADAERKNEYGIAVAQVRRSMLVLEHQPAMAKSGLNKKLHDKVFGPANGNTLASTQPATAPATVPTTGPAATSPAEKSMVAAFNRAGTSDALEGANEDGAADALRKKTIAALSETVTELEDAASLLEGDQSEFGKTFRGLAAKAKEQLTGYSKAWASAKLDTAKDRMAAAKSLRKLEDDLADAMGNVESMVTDKPLLVALAQATLATMLATPAEREQVSGEDWYKQLVAKAEEMGKEHQATNEWLEARSIYASLGELAPDNETYKDLGKKVQRHVRMLRLYGQAKPEAATAVGADEDADPTWKDLVEGVDVEMVRTAISKLDENYVEPPDYRKLAVGGLTAVKILAQTPQAKASFAKLGDDGKRASFVEAIDGLIDHVTKKDRVDHVDLQIFLNNIVRASDRSVEVPAAVLSVEYADGLLEELDRFSSMVWPYELLDFKKSTMGNFFGVGIQIGKEPNEPLKVVSPLEDSPAYKAGIKSGDLILAVDGLRTEKLNVDSLVKKISGPKDTKVVLTIKRPGMPPMEVPLVREEIKIKTVKGWQRSNGGNWDYVIDHDAKIGYVRITQFTDPTIEELTAQLEKMKNEGVKSLIVDLRFNPGGLLRSAHDVADEFLSQGRVVSTKGRQAKEAKYDADASGFFLEGDLVVLVNQFSASAAEIVAGALKDAGRATIVGQRSYGKGSVQHVIGINNNKAVLKATTAYYYLPSGRCLHRKNGDKEWGVDPDVSVSITPRQTKRWLDIRRKTDILSDADAAHLKAEMSEQLDADVQLKTAIVMLKLKQLQRSQEAVAAN